MTPPDEPPGNPYDPNWPKPEQPQEQPYGQDQPHGQAPYGQTQPYGQMPYGQMPSHGAAMAQQHPSATTSLVLGLLSLGGLVFCAGITLPLAPFAWWMGGKAVKEIDAQPGRYAGRDQAQAGRIMGIIGTILLVLGVLALIFIFVVALSFGTDTSTTYSDPTY